jgi:hypothetical protein
MLNDAVLPLLHPLRKNSESDRVRSSFRLRWSLRKLIPAACQGLGRHVILMARMEWFEFVTWIKCKVIMQTASFFVVRPERPVASQA